MARLRNEEMEEELVRYKLLSVLSPRELQAWRLIVLFASYAEAMHQNEHAMSSNRLSKIQMDRRGSGHT